MESQLLKIWRFLSYQCKFEPISKLSAVFANLCLRFKKDDKMLKQATGTMILLVYTLDQYGDLIGVTYQMNNIKEETDTT